MQKQDLRLIISFYWFFIFNYHQDKLQDEESTKEIILILTQHLNSHAPDWKEEDILSLCIEDFNRFVDHINTNKNMMDLINTFQLRDNVEKDIQENIILDLMKLSSDDPSENAMQFISNTAALWDIDIRKLLGMEESTETEDESVGVSDQSLGKPEESLRTDVKRDARKIKDKKADDPDLQKETKAETNSEAQFKRGKVNYADENFSEALNWYKKAAENGYIEAQFNLAVMYKDGKGTTQDYGEAVKWYKRAADQGHAKAQSALGVRYWQGEGVPQDYTEAAKWIRKAAEQGYANAQFNLGRMYIDGHGVPQNHEEAERWFRKAADDGHEEANEKLSSEFLDFDTIPQYPGMFYFVTEKYATRQVRIKKFLRLSKVTQLFRRFTKEEIELISNAINNTGTIPKLDFVRDILSEKYDIPVKDAPFWFLPFTICAEEIGCFVYFERNGFYGNHEEAREVSGIVSCNRITEMHYEKGFHEKDCDHSNNDMVLEWSDTEDDDLNSEQEYPDPKNSVSTLILETKDSHLTINEFHGSDFGSQLLIVNTIWSLWKKVVNYRPDEGVWPQNDLIPGGPNYKRFNSWDDLLDWAAKSQVPAKKTLKTKRMDEHDDGKTALIHAAKEGDMAKVCIACGTKNPDQANFCIRCGNTFKRIIEHYDAFISYRRESGSELAEVIQTKVEKITEGKKNIYVDVNELGKGRFDEALLGVIERTPNFIILLTPGALDRCMNEDDWVRREISHAIKTAKNIIPVMRDGFSFKDVPLPPDIATLPRYNAVQYSHFAVDNSIVKILSFMVGQKQPTHPTSHIPNGPQASKVTFPVPESAPAKDLRMGANYPDGNEDEKSGHRVRYDNFEEFKEAQGKYPNKKPFLPIAEVVHELLITTLNENNLPYDIRYGDGTFSISVPKDKAKSGKRTCARFGLLGFKGYSYLESLYKEVDRPLPQGAKKEADVPFPQGKKYGQKGILTEYSYGFDSKTTVQRNSESIKAAILNSYMVFSKT